METRIELLESVLAKTVGLLRTLLDNVSQEQLILSQGDPAALEPLFDQRLGIVALLEDNHAQLLESLETRKEHHSLASFLNALPDYIGYDHCSVLTLGEQSLALIDQIERQNGRNNYLLEMHTAHERIGASLQLARIVAKKESRGLQLGLLDILRD